MRDNISFMDPCEISSNSTAIPVGYVILTLDMTLAVGSFWQTAPCIRIGIMEGEVGMEEVAELGDIVL